VTMGFNKTPKISFFCFHTYFCITASLNFNLRGYAKLGRNCIVQYCRLQAILDKEKLLNHFNILYVVSCLFF
jgi:hypothetical protein